MTAGWRETHLPTILSSYKLEDIYNADEFGLFYQVIPSKSMHLKSERCSGGKQSKLRLTGLAAANATMVIRYQCLSLESQENLVVLKM